MTLNRLNVETLKRKANAAEALNRALSRGAAQVSKPARSPTSKLAGRRTILCLALGLLFSMFGSTPQSSAQEGLENLLFTAGTVTRDGASRDWAYLLWQASTPALVQGKTFALYAKAGDASSASPYARKAIVSLHTDPLVIAPLLSRAANLGDNLAELNVAMSTLFQSILPPGLLTPSEKLSAIIRGSVGDPDHESSLQLLARLHPSVGMVLGMAHAELIAAGKTTFEVRQFDSVKGQDLGVVGRVTVEAGKPITLPAPDQPVAVPEVDQKGNPKPESTKGNLNVKLRWATPNALRRLSMLNYGFNVYRMTKSFAEAPINNFQITPPSPATLLALAASNPNVHRVNQAPVMKTRDFDPGIGPGQVGDFISPSSDRTSYFIADDNDRFLPAGQPFADGAECYYFITARDILGRDGLVSSGGYVKICKRMPPLAPKALKVVNDYTFAGGTPRQALMLIWPQNASTTNDPTAEYWVYRWTSISNMLANEPSPLVNRIAVVPHAPGQETQTNLDYGLLGSPTLPLNAGQTFWYSVRAVDNGACGGNASGNSAPAYGVLRDREGPGSPTGYIEFNCVKPVARFVGIGSDQPNGQSDPTRFYFRVECARTALEIAWAEFYAQLATGSNFIGRQAFSGADPTVSISVDYSRTFSDSAQFFCRVALADGQVSDYAMSGPVSGPPNSVRVVSFAADVVVSTGRVGNALAGNHDPCVRHTPIPPGGGGTVLGPCLNVTLHPKTQAWKIYRRIDDGPLTLLKTGTNGPVLTLAYCDDALPPNLANGCYYVQAFDENGNASPMALIGCIQLGGTTPLPIPVLGSIRSGGTDVSPTMTLTWFCAPHGVDRFELGLAAWDGGKFVGLPAIFSTQLSSDLAPTPNLVPLVVKGATNTYDVRLVRSPKVGPQFGAGGAQFSVTANIDKSVQYTVFVRALEAGGGAGTNSNIQQFKWSPAQLDQPEVPWPARDLPPVTSSFHPGIAAVQLRDAFDGLAVCIGGVAVDPATQVQTNYPTRIPGHTENPMTWIFTNAPTGQSVLPIALYRYQVPNANYPAVSGGVAQVSPLMELIAYAVEGGSVAIYDPFIRVWRDPHASGPYGVYLIDTQPVVIGAKYKYLLARFKPNHEIDQVIATNEVEVQP